MTGPPPGVASGRRTQAERRASSERALLDAAARLIAERGSTKATFAEIAARAGCSHGHPHYLFGTKDRMLEALVDDLAARFDDVIEAELAGRSGLRAVRRCVGLFLSSLADPWSGTRTMYVLLGESLGAAPQLRDPLHRYHERLLRLVAGWIREGVEDGEVRPDADPDTEAALVVATVRGIGLLVLNDPGTPDVASLAAAALDNLDRNLGARR